MDPVKVQAIRDMPALKIEKQVRGFLGRINYIVHFTVQLTATCDVQALEEGYEDRNG